MPESSFGELFGTEPVTLEAVTGLPPMTHAEKAPINAREIAAEMRRRDQKGALQQEELGKELAAQQGQQSSSFDELFGTAAKQPEDTSPTYLESFVERAKAVGGSMAAVGDLILSLPNFVWGHGMALGATLAAPRGDKEAYAKALKFAEKHGGRPLNPLQRALAAVGEEQAYEGSVVSQGMGKFTQLVKDADAWAQKKGVPAGATEMFINNLMVGAGGLGRKPSVGQEALNKLQKQQPSIPGARESYEPPAPLPPDAVEAAGPQRTAQATINESLGIRDPADQQKYLRQRRAEVRAAFKADEGPAGEKKYADYLSALAEERVNNRAPAAGEAEGIQYRVSPENVYTPPEAPPSRPAPGDVFRALRKPALERTAEDKIILRAAGETGMKVGGLTAGGIALAAMDPEERKAALGGVGLAMAAAIKSKGGMFHPEAADRMGAPLKEALVGREEHIVDDLIRRGELSPDATNAEMNAAIDKYQANVGETPLRMVQTYLQRHAGTATDPLRDIPLSQQVNSQTWGEAMDRALSSKPAIAYHRAKARGMDLEDIPNLERIPPMEPIWNFAADVWKNEPGAQAIKSFLGHVGDYLRLNVDPAKLPQMDLVRAVQETVKADERMAREAMKEAMKGDSAKAAEQAHLPTLREYPAEQLPARTFRVGKEGAPGIGLKNMNEVKLPAETLDVKWVEFKLPEKLTEEQARSVRPVKGSEIQYLPDGALENVRSSGERGYLALDTKGNPIKNTFTQRLAGGATPEEAWLSGQLAKEGNSLAHCVGGYCSEVLSGESRIIGLRDAKGRSLATVEVKEAPRETAFHKMVNQLPADAMMELDTLANDNPGIRGAALYDLAQKSGFNLPKLPDDVIQIKGPGNAAVAEPYVKYIADFLNNPPGGKPWGEVNLDMSGLVRGSDVFKFSDFRKMAEQAGIKFDDNKFYTKEEVDKLLESANVEVTRQGPGRPPERGSADPRLLARLAIVAGGAALGAYLSPEHPLRGGLIGLGLGFAAAGGALNPRKLGRLAGKIAAPGKLVKIDALTESVAGEAAVGQRAGAAMRYATEKLVPKLAGRERLFRKLSGYAVKLEGKEPQAFRDLKQFFDAGGLAALSKGVIDDLVTHYAPLIYRKINGPFDINDFLSQGAGLPTTSRFGIPRKGLSIEEARKLGYELVTEDIGKIVEAWTESVTRAGATRRLLDTLKSTNAPDGKPLMVRARKAPEGYDRNWTNQNLAGWATHPGIHSDIAFNFPDKSTLPPSLAGVVKGMELVNVAQKRIVTEATLFHAASLAHALLGVMRLTRSPIIVAKGLAQSLAPMIFGQQALIRQLREGAVGDQIGKLLQAGLKVSFGDKPGVREMQGNFVEALDAAARYLDKTVPHAGAPVRFALKADSVMNGFLWGRLWTGWKLSAAMEKVEMLTRNNIRANARDPSVPLKSEAEIYRIAAEHANFAFGGLNWLNVVHDFSNAWSRELAAAAFGSTGRRVGRFALFALDWTVATTGAFLKADFPNLVRHPIEGVKGIIRPQELHDLHRQYLLRSAFLYSVFVDALNVQMSGHHYWENDDPTRLDRGDGTTQQVSKHFMEPMHWLREPGKTAVGKLGFWPKMVGTQLTGKEYLSTTGASRMGGPALYSKEELAARREKRKLGVTPAEKPISLGARATHIIKMFTPITVAQNFEPGNLERPLWSILGSPIYGKTEEEKRRAREDLKMRRLMMRQQ